MKLNLILHVGIHKTGTTAIQSFLSLNKELLKKHGFYFPQVDCIVENKPYHLREALLINNRHEYEEIINRIITSAKDANCHTVILSDEDFQIFAHKGNNNLGILKHFFNVELLMYIRRQDRYSESAYGFSILWYSSRTTIEPDNLLDLFPALNYDYLLKRWENLFGIDNINLKVYDNLISNGDLINDFISLLNISTNEDWVKPTKDLSNITFNKHILEFLKRINYIPFLYHEFEEIKKFLVTRSSIKHGPKAIFLNERLRKSLLEEVEISNCLVARRYFNREELFFDNKISSYMPPSLSEESFLNVVSEINQEFEGYIITDDIINNEKIRDIVLK